MINDNIPPIMKFAQKHGWPIVNKLDDFLEPEEIIDVSPDEIVSGISAIDFKGAGYDW